MNIVEINFLIHEKYSDRIDITKRKRYFLNDYEQVNFHVDGDLLFQKGKGERALDGLATFLNEKT